MYNKKVYKILIVIIISLMLLACNNNELPTSTNDNIENNNSNKEIINNQDELIVETDNTSEENIEEDLPTRDMIPDEYKWDLTKIYNNTDAFMNDVSKVKLSFDSFKEMKDEFTSNYSSFIAVLDLYQDSIRRTEKLYVFATLQSHTDTSNTEFTDLEEIAAQLSSDFNKATSYIWPMVANLDEKVLDTYMSNEKSKEYTFFINEILLEKEYILSEDEEEILAQAEILFKVPESIYESYNYLTDLSEYLPEPDWDKFWYGNREDRKKALEAYYAKTSAGINLISEIYESEVKKNTFFAEARGYNNALESVLSTDGITNKEYDLFFDITHANLDKLHKWIDIKREILGIEDEFHIYDQYSPLIENPYSFIEYEDGIQVIYNALEPLGSKYKTDLENAFNSRWADVYTTKGKYEGGYQWGTYDTDPFVLLNFYGLMTDVSTVAHEMGHAINFKYSNEKQGYFSSSVPIFSAEIASTTNESLVFEYQIKNAKNNEEKQRALLDYISLIENTIFTQMIYADFEKRVYEAYENNEALDADFFNGIMTDVLIEYYGENYYVDEMASHQWAEIPHFYNAFYVYKYATGLSAGLTFSDNILNGRKSDIDRYLVYLASGSSEAPLTLLKKAGVDFTTGQSLQRAYDRFDELIDEFYDTFK